MKLSKVVLSTVVVEALTLIAGQAVSLAYQPEKPKEAPKDKAAQPDATEMAPATPGDEHKILQKLVGTWAVVTKFSMPGADRKMQDISDTGEARFKNELNGMFLRQDFNGQFNKKPFQGFGYTGYDQIEKKYIGTWADNYGSGMMYMTGQYDKATKTQTMTGSFKMPTPTGEIEDVHARYVTVYNDDDHFTFSMYHTGKDGKEMKIGDIMYTRKK